MYRPDLEAGTPDAIRNRQFLRLNGLLREVLPANRFYQAKLGGCPAPHGWDEFRRIPFTTKQELVADQAARPPLGSIATYELTRYRAYHQTSGTTGRPLIVLDTPESWDWWAECWNYVYHAAGVTPSDRIFFAFSFGPFIGFWSAFEGARRLGALTIPGGGMDSMSRLELMRRSGATVLLSTPTYALRLVEIARDQGQSLQDIGVRVTIHAGEPGGSIPAVQSRIDDAFGSRSFDHSGATEVGAYGFSCEVRDGVHVNEEEFIAEVIDPLTGKHVMEGDSGELVITNLGRPGWPVIRYRTGDLVNFGGRRCACGRTFLKLPGGLLGRVDDLIIVRGVNIYPSSVEAIVRTFEVDEFRLVRTLHLGMEELAVEVEAHEDVARPLADALRQRLGVRIPTRMVSATSLPRFELKAKRVIDLRNQPANMDGWTKL
jgi:phenylacetate-CoA ligase